MYIYIYIYIYNDNKSIYIKKGLNVCVYLIKKVPAGLSSKQENFHQLPSKSSERTLYAV